MYIYIYIYNIICIIHTVVRNDDLRHGQNVRTLSVGLPRTPWQIDMVSCADPKLGSPTNLGNPQTETCKTKPLPDHRLDESPAADAQPHAEQLAGPPPPEVPWREHPLPFKQRHARVNFGLIFIPMGSSPFSFVSEDVSHWGATSHPLHWSATPRMSPSFPICLLHCPFSFISSSLPNFPSFKQLHQKDAKKQRVIQPKGGQVALLRPPKIVKPR